MPEPTTTTAAAAATLVSAPAVVSALTVFGVSLGLRPDVLIAGFSGALVAIVLLASVPSDGDTWRHLLGTTVKRMFVSLASSLTAGYLTPIFLLPLGEVHLSILLGTAFVIGAGAQQFLRAAIERVAVTPANPSRGGGQ
jgi:hypothetical protein